MKIFITTAQKPNSVHSVLKCYTTWPRVCVHSLLCTFWDCVWKFGPNDYAPTKGNLPATA